MRIIQLPDASNASPDDVFVININGIDYQVTGEVLAAMFQAAGNYLTTNDLPLSVSNGGTGARNATVARTNLAAVGTADIVNNLNTTAAGKVLDARQGKALADAVARAFHDGIEVTTPNFSSLPVTFNAPGITADHELVQDGFAYLSNPAAARSDWTITTGAGTVTISGTISGTTNVKASFCIKQKVTATA